MSMSLVTYSIVRWRLNYRIRHWMESEGGDWVGLCCWPKFASPLEGVAGCEPSGGVLEKEIENPLDQGRWLKYNFFTQWWRVSMLPCLLNPSLIWMGWPMMIQWLCMKRPSIIIRNSSLLKFMDEELMSLIPRMVSDEENNDLLRPFIMEETKDATFSIPLDTMARVDDFSPDFFIHSRDVVKQSIFATSNDKKHLSRSLSHAYLIMIPKANNPTTLTDFRPISLCSTVYKIFAKMIYRRLSFFFQNSLPLTRGLFFEEIHFWKNSPYSGGLSRDGMREEVNLSSIWTCTWHVTVWSGTFSSVLLCCLDSGRSGFTWLKLVSNCQFSVNFHGVIKVILHRGYFASSRCLRRGIHCRQASSFWLKMCCLEP